MRTEVLVVAPKVEPVGVGEPQRKVDPTGYLLESLFCVLDHHWRVLVLFVSDSKLPSLVLAPGVSLAVVPRALAHL